MRVNEKVVDLKILEFLRSSKILVDDNLNPIFILAVEYASKFAAIDIEIKREMSRAGGVKISDLLGFAVLSCLSRMSADEEMVGEASRVVVALLRSTVAQDLLDEQVAKDLSILQGSISPYG